MRGESESVAADAPPAIAIAHRLAPTEATRCWAALLQQILEVDPLACPSATAQCGSPRSSRKRR